MSPSFSFYGENKSYTREEFLRGKSKPLNAKLMKIAINIELTDQTGKGNKDIVKAYGPGAFELCDSFLTVRIPYNPLALDSPLSNGGGVSGGEVESDDFAAILSLVSESGGATTADIVSGTGIPKRTVERRLAP